jgi:methylated-DNA-[protein]-cysteine S-methyltransferase
MKLFFDQLPAKFGTIHLVSDGERMVSLDFKGFEERLHKLMSKRYEAYELVDQDNPQGFTDILKAYLAGDITAVDAIPVDTGGTEFQKSCWELLRKIPAGETWTYGQMAKVLGNPNASRAVGITNSLNPVGIVVPCHRVIGASGKLTGYAGGLNVKDWLLKHEGAQGQLL